MTYSNNTPLGEPSPKDQQAQIKTNFSQFASIFSSTVLGINYNHTALNLANQGKHEAVIFQNQASHDVIDDDFVSLYSLSATSNVTPAGTPQLFVKIPKFIPNITSQPMQLTCESVNTAGPQYQSFIVGGNLVYFGSGSGVAVGTANITIAIVLSPTPTTVLATIPSANAMTGTGTAVPLAIGVDALTPSFNIILQSPGNGQTYAYSWFCIAKA